LEGGRIWDHVLVWPLRTVPAIRSVNSHGPWRASFPLFFSRASVPNPLSIRSGVGPENWRRTSVAYTKPTDDWPVPPCLAEIPSWRTRWSWHRANIPDSSEVTKIKQTRSLCPHFGPGRPESGPVRLVRSLICLGSQTAYPCWNCATRIWRLNRYLTSSATMVLPRTMDRLNNLRQGPHL
jgi:hypothetical protein